MVTVFIEDQHLIWLDQIIFCLLTGTLRLHPCLSRFAFNVLNTTSALSPFQKVVSDGSTILKRSEPAKLKSNLFARFIDENIQYAMFI